MNNTSKFCARCGNPFIRKVMLTAKYCSAECRAKNAKEAYENRQKTERNRVRLVQANAVRIENGR